MRKFIHATIGAITILTSPILLAEYFLANVLLGPLRAVFRSALAFMLASFAALFIHLFGFEGFSQFAFGVAIFGFWSRTGAYLAMYAMSGERPRWLRDLTVFEGVCLLNRILLWVALASAVRGIWIVAIRL